MTRKHFTAIAETINLIPDSKDRGYIAREMATRLAEFNPSLDRARFIKACGA